jgi:hypothetical protein
MGAICSSETSVDGQRTTRRYIPEDGTFLALRHITENSNRYVDEASTSEKGGEFL